MTPEKLGRYEILGELGKGAMGVVYLARDPIIDRQLAIKTFRMAYSAREKEVEQFRQRFLREAQTVGKLSHPNIVTVHDVGQEDDEYFIAMEYIKGIDLKQQMQREERLEVAYVVDVVAQIAEGLAAAHEQGVVHRDVKPANIIITADQQAKITDFGIARIEQSNLTVAGQLLGTPNYMAPEQIQGKDVDSRTDIFSLGVMLYELLTKKKPFQGENLTQVSHRIVYDEYTSPDEFVEDLSPELLAILGRALNKIPDERYQDAAEMARDLRDVLREDGESTDAALEPPPPPSQAAQAATPPAVSQSPPSAATVEASAAVTEVLPAVESFEPVPPPPAQADFEPAPPPPALPGSQVVPPPDPGTGDIEREPPPPPGVPDSGPLPPPPAAPSHLVGHKTIPTGRMPASPAQVEAAARRAPKKAAKVSLHRKALGALLVVLVVALGIALLYLGWAWSRTDDDTATTVTDPPSAARPSAARPSAARGEATLLAEAERLAGEVTLPAALAYLQNACEREICSRNVQLYYLELAEQADAEDDVVKAYVAERMTMVEAFLQAKQYEEALDVLELVLLADPEHTRALEKAEDIERLLGRRRQPRVQQSRRGSSQQASPPATSPQGTPPPPTRQTGELKIAFRTLVATGQVKVVANATTVFEESFDFPNRKLFARRKLRSEEGIDRTLTFDAGAVQFTVDVEVQLKEGPKSLSRELGGVRIPADATGTLWISVSEDVSLNVRFE